VNWVEPWLAVLYERPKYRLGKKQLVSGSIFAACLAVMLPLSLIGSSWLDFVGALNRIWVAVPLGFGLSVAMYTIYWVFPGTVGIGPRGLVRDSGGAILLVPWGAIQSYSISNEPRAKVLTVTTVDGLRHRFLAPLRFSSNEIARELKLHCSES
jgi:hypothetical protein